MMGGSGGGEGKRGREKGGGRREEGGGRREGSEEGEKGSIIIQFMKKVSLFIKMSRSMDLKHLKPV